MFYVLQLWQYNFLLTSVSWYSPTEHLWCIFKPLCSVTWSESITGGVLHRLWFITVWNDKKFLDLYWKQSKKQQKRDVKKENNLVLVKNEWNNESDVVVYWDLLSLKVAFDSHKQLLLQLHILSTHSHTHDEADWLPPLIHRRSDAKQMDESRFSWLLLAHVLFTVSLCVFAVSWGKNPPTHINNVWIWTDSVSVCVCVCVCVCSFLTCMTLRWPLHSQWSWTSPGPDRRTSCHSWCSKCRCTHCGHACSAHKHIFHC